MKSRIFGSTAIKYWFPDYDKIPKDVDYITDNIVYTDLPDVEQHKPITDAFNVLLKHNTHEIYVDADLLYTIKLSHLPWEGKNGKWFKHLKDLVFLQNKGCKLNVDVYQAFYREWQARFGDKSHITLNKATEMFFKDGVRRKYDHDWMHEYLKVGDVPAYTRALKVEGSPMMDVSKFLSLPLEHQLHCALEEMFVVSAERGVSLTTAYKSLITTMTKGWFPQFMLVNAENLLNGFTEEKNQYRIKLYTLLGDKDYDKQRNY